jgi:hypothetical protein
MAPPYFVYLLRAYCFTPSGRFLPANLVKLGATVIAVFAASLGPFIRHLPQLGQRLFPFTRGLNHAYWAGNVWALVTLADRALLKCACHLTRPAGERAFVPDLRSPADGSRPETRLQARRRRGRCGQLYQRLRWRHRLCCPAERQARALLSFDDRAPGGASNAEPRPSVCSRPPLPHAANARRFGGRQVFSAKLWFRPSYKVFVWALAISGYTSFLFGWHVHEKAVLLFLVPLRCVFPITRSVLRLD